MKNTIVAERNVFFSIFLGFVIVLSASVVSTNINDASAQTYKTKPNPFGGGYTTRGSDGSSCRTRRDPFGGGVTTNCR